MAKSTIMIPFFLTMPPISSGMNTAISDALIETMVKPISPAPLMAASTGAMPSSTWR